MRLTDKIKCVCGLVSIWNLVTFTNFCRKEIIYLTVFFCDMLVQARANLLSSKFWFTFDINVEMTLVCWAAVNAVIVFSTWDKLIKVDQYVRLVSQENKETKRQLLHETALDFVEVLAKRSTLRRRCFFFCHKTHLGCLWCPYSQPFSWAHYE